MQSFLNFFKSSNLFNWYPSYSNQFILVELIFLVILIIIFFSLTKIIKNQFSQYKVYQSLSGKISSLFITCLTLGFVLLFLQWQEIPYLSAPVFTLVVLIVIIVWSLILIRYYITGFKRSIDTEIKNRNFKKYLPKSKKG